MNSNVKVWTSMVESANWRHALNRGNECYDIWCNALGYGFLVNIAMKKVT